MDDKIRQALGQLQAPRQVKDRAYQAVLEKAAPKPKRRPVAPYWCSCWGREAGCT